MKIITLLFSSCFYFLQVHAQNINYWTAVSESELDKNIWNNNYKPLAYKIFKLNEAALRNILKDVPSEEDMWAGKQGITITVPDDDGNIKRFSVYLYSQMQPKLTAKYADIKTFIGKGIDDASATIYCSLTVLGFNAVINYASKITYYINAIDSKKNIYIVNARNENDPREKFKCDVNELITKKNELSVETANTVNGNADDGRLRTYRLALCVNGEFSQYYIHGMTDTMEMKRIVMSRLNIILEIVNSIYERDFGIQLKYVDNEDTLIFFNPGTDPWPAQPDDVSWEDNTQQTIDQLIGMNNYDIGHLLGKVKTEDENRGHACVGCVCKNVLTDCIQPKGSGFTAYDSISNTKNLVSDYLAHEIGHQFGANHTFTYKIEKSYCLKDFVQIEPGSGSTIMSYAGIPGGDTSVQPHNSNIFAGVSISQVTRYVKNVATRSFTCGVVVTVTGNHPPTVASGGNKTIPKSTPFKLTGIAKDNDGDALSYIWEQTDVFEKGTSNTFPISSSTTGPIFRTYSVKNNTYRYFPDSTYILNGSLDWKWEKLPAVGRTLNFRFTARDNHAGGGNNKSANAIITIDPNSGPFKLITNKASWNIKDSESIKWDVKNTNLAPINCAYVNILLSTDGGKSFKYTLALKTPNDGNEKIVVPDFPTKKARIKVEAVNNIFFTISQKDFTIKQGPLPGAFSLSGSSFCLHGCGPQYVVISWSPSSNADSYIIFQGDKAVSGYNDVNPDDNIDTLDPHFDNFDPTIASSFQMTAYNKYGSTVSNNTFVPLACNSNVVLQYCQKPLTCITCCPRKYVIKYGLYSSSRVAKIDIYKDGIFYHQKDSLVAANVKFQNGNLDANFYIYVSDSLIKPKIRYKLLMTDSSGVCESYIYYMDTSYYNCPLIVCANFANILNKVKVPNSFEGGNTINVSVRTNVNTLSIQIKNLRRQLYFYKITDINGRVIKNGSSGKETETVDISNLTSGTYFFSIISEKQSVSKKLFVPG
jgi:hypothetical protein